MMKFSRRDLLASASSVGVISLVSDTFQAQASTPSEAPENSEARAFSEGEISRLKHITQNLVPPPGVPLHDQVATGAPKVVQVRMVVEEKAMTIDDEGTVVQAMTYNGSVPGPLIVVHQGDYVELTLENPDSNELEHNIDFHAATGAMGGGGLTHVLPGERVVLRFRATKAGVFVYHCAPGGIMVPWHVVCGMNGAMMVLPRNGLRDHRGVPVHYDRVFYIGEQDFYVPRDEHGEFRTYESLSDSFPDMLEVMKTLTPSHVLLNGQVGALTDDKALKAQVGETVLFIHAQANRDSRPHLIGGHGDLVWETGSFDDPPATNQETWFIRGGSAGAALYTFRQPGLYAYLTHNLIEAFALGAVAHVQVDGDWNNDLMVQVQPPTSLT